jgi:hypothetical protein
VNVTTWIRYWSSVVAASNVALAAPLARKPSATMRSESKPSALTYGGRRWESESVPSNDTELLNRLFWGFAASASSRPFRASLSPALPRSPS